MAERPPTRYDIAVASKDAVPEATGAGGRADALRRDFYPGQTKQKGDSLWKDGPSH